MRLQPGDYIIMVTDCVQDAFSQDGQEDAWQELLLHLTQKAPKRMSEEILSSIPQNDKIPADDRTVLGAGFWDKQE